MKKCLSVLGLFAVAASGLACNGVAYSGKERAQLIARNWELEWRQLNDDVDTVLLLRPVSELTPFHVRP
jgi:hypothetical protein